VTIVIVSATPVWKEQIMNTPRNTRMCTALILKLDVSRPWMD